MAKPQRTIPVHMLDDERVHLAPPHLGRLAQGRLKTLCGKLAVTELPRILALVTALRLIFPAHTAFAFRFLVPTLQAAQTTPQISARNSAIVATTFA